MKNLKTSQITINENYDSTGALIWWKFISPDQYFEMAALLSIQEWNEINDDICNPKVSNDENDLEKNIG